MEVEQGEKGKGGEKKRKEGREERGGEGRGGAEIHFSCCQYKEPSY